MEKKEGRLEELYSNFSRDLGNIVSTTEKLPSCAPIMAAQADLAAIRSLALSIAENYSNQTGPAKGRGG